MQKRIISDLKQHLGLSSKEIELDATSELKRLKNRLAGRRKNQRKRGQLPPYEKSNKKIKTDS